MPSSTWQLQLSSKPLQSSAPLGVQDFSPSFGLPSQSMKPDLHFVAATLQTPWTQVQITWSAAAKQSCSHAPQLAVLLERSGWLSSRPSQFESSPHLSLGCVLVVVPEQTSCPLQA